MLIDPEDVALVEIMRIDRDEWYNHPGAAAPLGRHLATVQGEPARDLVTRLAQLPAGERMRCFLPRYAIRVWDQDTNLTDAAICFRCHWVSYRRGGREQGVAFDADTAASRLLLDLLRSHDDSYPDRA